MLCQAHRLRKRQDFALAYQYGTRWRGRHLLLRTRKQRSPANQPSPATRIGIIVSQKVSKRAVKRNRIKRRLRAACRELWPQILPGWDVVITVQTHQPLHSQNRSSTLPIVLGCSYKEFLQELRELLAEAKVLDGH